MIPGTKLVFIAFTIIPVKLTYGPGNGLLVQRMTKTEPAFRGRSFLHIGHASKGGYFFQTSAKLTGQFRKSRHFALLESQSSSITHSWNSARVRAALLAAAKCSLKR
jgi:hypothetical protein